jgi:hypothetical protein
MNAEERGVVREGCNGKLAGGVLEMGRASHEIEGTKRSSRAEGFNWVGFSMSKKSERRKDTVVRKGGTK